MTTYVDITPDVSLLAKIGQSGHSISDAVAELVDNALDAREIGRSVRVSVDLDADGSRLTIRDNAHGMSAKQLAQALVLGRSEKSHDQIGRFGLGLKTACTSLGASFSVTTATPDAHYSSVCRYDAALFAEEGQWRLPVARKKKTFKQGTEIVIDCGRLYPSLPATLARNLGWTFRHFIVDKVLNLSINSTRVTAAEYDVDPASVMPFKGVVGGYTVRGWVGLLHKSSQRGWYGFALVRHRRVVRRHEKLGFQAHPQTARVVGEIHLDAFDTNNLKTDFIRETPEWLALEEWVSVTVEPVVAASRALAHAGMLDLKIKTHLAAQRDSLDDEEGSRLNMPDGLARLDGSRSEPVAVAVGPLHLEHVFVRGGSGFPYSEITERRRDGEADLLVVASNLDHLAAGQIMDRSGWACHNVAEAAAQHLGRAANFLELKSVILDKLLAERGLRRALALSARNLVAVAVPRDGSTVVISN